MKYQNMNRWIKVLIIVAALWFTSTVKATTPVNWKDIGFSIDANGMKLEDVFKEFGVAYGVRVSVGIKSTERLKGRLKADNGSEFLERLMHTHDFRWFVYNGTLYIVPRNDNTSLRIAVGEDAVQDAKSALIGVGLYEVRFGWGELPDEGVVLVNGPTAYVELVRDILLPEAKKQSPKGKEMMIFRLKYASATDRVITVRGQKETVSGVKSILNGLLGQDTPEKSANNRDKFDVASTKRSRTPKNDKDTRETDKGTARDTDSNSRTFINRSQSEEDNVSDNSRSTKTKTTGREDRPRIDADTSLNAIIIYDGADKREMYKKLIAEIDIEPQQVEIEALIVDIDRNKLSDLGVEWGVSNGDRSVTINNTTADSAGLTLPIPGSTMLISNAARFYARLKMMENTGDAHVLAKPTVLTLNNVAAVLDLSQTAYVPLVGERIADLANVTAGTMLRVVPRVVQEGSNTRVRLEIDIEDGALGDSGVKSNVTRSTISTQAIIDLQQTLMIGGYHSESKSQTKQKVPLLGDAPIFGNLFRSTNETYTTRERLFLITPRLSGSTGIAAEARSKASQMAREATVFDKEREKERQNEKLTEQVKNKQAESVTLSVPVVNSNLDKVTEKNIPVKLVDNSIDQQQPIARKQKCAKPKMDYSLGGVNLLL